MKTVSYKVFSLFLTLSLIVVSLGATALSSATIEETADYVLPSDRVMTGELDEYSDGYIVVDNFRFSLCKNVLIFTPRNTLIQVKDIGSAEEVTVFSNNNCVRKIKVLRFAE